MRYYDINSQKPMFLRKDRDFFLKKLVLALIADRKVKDLTTFRCDLFTTMFTARMGQSLLIFFSSLTHSTTNIDAAGIRRPEANIQNGV